MQSDIDFVYQGPLIKTQKTWIHPTNPEVGSKPGNVLWTSPVNPETGESAWIEFCRNEDMKADYYGQQSWHIVPHSDSRILTLLPESEEMRKYETTNKYGDKILDFEAIAQDYDALYVPQETIDACGGTSRRGILAVWDVPSCVFLTPKYTVMNDEMYADYLAGKWKPDERNREFEFNPEVENLQHRTLPQLKFLTPQDYSPENALSDLQKMLEDTSQRTLYGQDKAYYIQDVIEFVQNGGFEKGFNSKVLRGMAYPDVLETLLKHGMNPDKTEWVDSEGRSVPSTSEVRDVDCLKLLLQYGGDPNAALQKDMISSSCEILNGYPLDRGLQRLKLCLSAGADPNFPDKDGKTPLMSAVHPQQVEWLLIAGADPLAQDHNGKSVADHIGGNQTIYGYRVATEKLLAQAVETLELKAQMKKDHDLAMQFSPREKIAESVLAQETPQQDKSLLLSRLIAQKRSNDNS